MMSIRSNLQAASAANALGRTQGSLTSSLERVSSGRRVNRAADDAAGLGVSVNLETTASSLRVAINNANDGLSIVQVAEQASNTSTDMLQRMRELAIQGSSETLADDERSYLEDEFTELIDEIRLLGQRTDWNGTILTDGLTPSIDVQVGTNNSTADRIALVMPNLRTVWSTVNSDTVATRSGAQAAIANIDTALDLTNADRANLGAGANRLMAAIEHASISQQALTSASAQIVDTDFAVETASLTRLQIMQSAGVASLAQSKNLNQGVLGLL